MQPYLFPYLGYFQLIHAVDRFLLYDNLDYIKEGWVNRNRLLSTNGTIFNFVVPLARKSSNRKIRDMRIASDFWRSKLRNNILRHYRRSLYFDEIFSVLDVVIRSETDSLSRLNKASVKQICGYLDISTRIDDDPVFEELEERLAGPTGDLATKFPDIQLENPVAKVIRPIEICRSLGAQVLVNPVGGASLYPREEFRRNDVDVRFLQMKDVRYAQTCSGPGASAVFHGSLSIIDVLMNCGKQRTAELLNEFELV